MAKAALPRTYARSTRMQSWPLKYAPFLKQKSSEGTVSGCALERHIDIRPQFSAFGRERPAAPGAVYFPSKAEIVPRGSATVEKPGGGTKLPIGIVASVTESAITWADPCESFPDTASAMPL